MGIKTYKPKTPGLRWRTGYTFEEITKKRPEKSLTVALKKTGGRNAHGRLTARHIGGGEKQRYRIIDFKRDKRNIEARVIAIEYDPNRSSRIALVQYPDGEKRYIICPVDLKVSDTVISGENVEAKTGNALPLKNIPTGTTIYCLELEPGRGATLIRSAGSSAQLVAKEGNFAHIKMPSGEVRLFNINCYATVGQVGNPEHNTISIGTAGRARHMGRRPKVRGVAMNPHDHPMGGGEGKASGGHPKSPWGQYAKGFKTRKRHKASDRYIVKRRK
jgi:large subunit ribosomal protein L2